MQTGSAADKHRADRGIVHRVGNTMEKNPIARDDFIALILQTVPFLRMSAAAVSGRKDNLHAQVIEHA